MRPSLGSHQKNNTSRHNFMKKYWNRYLAGLFFIALGMYAFFESNDIPETFLYGSLGVAFTIMGFIGQHPNHPQLKLLNIVSWVLIFVAGLSFLYVLTIPS